MNTPPSTTSSRHSATARAARAGVVLSFDDYSRTWNEQLPLLEALDIKATFFVAGEFVRDESEAERRLRPLLEAGHSLGVHTFSHRRASEMWATLGKDWLQTDVLGQAAALGRLAGAPIIAFAYPYGNRNDAIDETLKPHFHILRGFGNKVVFTTARRLRDGGLVHATSIDNKYAREPAWYDEQLTTLCHQSRFWAVASHHIDESKWGITPERLTQFTESARRLGLPILRFDDFLE